MRLALTTTLAATLVLAACGEGQDVEVKDAPLSTQQSLTLLTLFDEGMEPVLHFGWSFDYGWHFSVAQQQVDVVSRFSSQDAQSIGDAFSDLGGEGGMSPPRFQASAAIIGGFSASTDAAHGFSASSGGASSFSAGTGAASGFSASLSAGGITCDLSGICGLVATFCALGDAISQDAGGGSIASECNAAVNECVANIGTIQASIPAAYAGFICVLADVFACVGDAVLSAAANPESFGGDIESLCAGELAQLEAAGLAALASFDDSGSGSQQQMQ